MTRPLTRRQFVAGSTASVALSATGCITLWNLQERPLPPDEQPRVACIGVGRQGWMDAQRIAAAGARITALCDVDRTPPKWVFAMKDVAKLFPDARFFRDYRSMLRDHAEQLDAVVVSTPDHHLSLIHI